jgi:hypothetical protein
MFNAYLSDGTTTIRVQDAVEEFRSVAEQSTPLKSLVSKPTDLPLGYANSFAMPLHDASRASIVVRNGDLDSLNLNARMSLQFVSDSPVSSAITWRNLVICREPQAIQTGLADNFLDSSYMVELSDVRWLFKNSAYSLAINVQYNILGTADATTYYGDSLNSGVAWTWAQMIGDIWGNMLQLGPFPGLPFTPNGTPLGFVFRGISAWDALTVVLRRIGCAVRADLTRAAGSQFTIVQIGAADAAAAAILATANAQHLLIHDGSFTDFGLRYPAGCRVFFPRDKTIASRNSTWETTNVYTIDVPGTVAGAEAGLYTPIWDDMRAIEAAGVITNVSALLVRAEERTAEYFRMLGAGGLRQWQRYSGLVNVVTGSTLKAVRWVADTAGAWTEIALHDDAMLPVETKTGFTGCLSRSNPCTNAQESEWYQDGELIAVNAIACPECGSTGSGDTCPCPNMDYCVVVPGLTNGFRSWAAGYTSPFVITKGFPGAGGPCCYGGNGNQVVPGDFTTSPGTAYLCISQGITPGAVLTFFGPGVADKQATYTYSGTINCSSIVLSIVGTGNTDYNNWPATITITPTPCSGGSGGAISIIGVGLATSFGASVKSLTYSATVQAGLIVVNVTTIFDVGGPTTVSYNGVNLTKAASANNGSHNLSQYYGTVSAMTANIVIIFSSPVACQSNADNITGLASNLKDVSQTAVGTTPPNTGTTGTSATANEGVIAAFFTGNPSGTPAWGGTPTFTDGMQSVTDVVFGGTITLQEGRYIASATGTFDAALTGVTTASFLGLVVSYK